MSAAAESWNRCSRRTANCSRIVSKSQLRKNVSLWTIFRTRTSLRWTHTSTPLPLSVFGTSWFHLLRITLLILLAENSAKDHSCDGKREQYFQSWFFFPWLLALQRREEEATQMRQKISKQAKMREVLQKKLHQLEEQKADVEVERDTLKVQIPALEKGTIQQRQCNYISDQCEY